MAFATAKVAAMPMPSHPDRRCGHGVLRCPEAGTAEAYRRALAGGGSTRRPGLHRAVGPGIRHRFLDRHNDAAPVAYPEVHHLTAPLRQAVRAAGDPGLNNLWAGQSFELGRELAEGGLVALVAVGRRGG